MSYIMEALKRAEEERLAGRVAVRPLPQRLARPALPWWAVAIVAALLVNAVVLAFAFLPDRSGPPPVAGREDLPRATVLEQGPTAVVEPRSAPRDPPARAAGSVAPAVPVSGTGQVRVRQDAKPVAPTPPRPGASEAKAPALAEPPATAPAASASGAPPSAALPGDAAASGRVPLPGAPDAASSPVQPPVTAPPRLSSGAPVAAPGPAGPVSPGASMAAARSSATSPGSVAPGPPGTSSAGIAAPPAGPGSTATMPPSSSRPDVSTLRLEVLVSADVPSQRMAFINGRKYVEGQSLADGLLVERITEDGVLLSAEGRQFLLRPPQ